jgi:hypothetical protein
MAHLVACNYPKCNHKCNHKLGFQSYSKSTIAMDENFWVSCKVCVYIFNFMPMSCFLQLTVLWHLSKVTKLFSVTCVHYNYKCVANLIVDFQKNSSVYIFFRCKGPNLLKPLLCFITMLVKIF